MTDASGNATELITWHFVGHLPAAQCGGCYPVYPWNVSNACAGITEAASLYLRQVEILSPRLPRQFAGAAYQFAMNASLVAAWLATARLTPRWSDGDPIDVTARVR